MMQDRTATRRRAIVAPLIRLVINAAIPVLVYLLVRPHVRSDLTALVVHAVVLTVLAVSTSTTTFLAVSRPVSWLIIGGSLAGLVVWIRRQRGGPGVSGRS